MTFMFRKKKYQFSVNVHLEELSSVPFINGVVYAKLRLLNGGNFCQTSEREEVQDHSVKWQQTFKFMVKMTADFSSGILDSCKLRISIRREVKGGRSSLKLGFVDLNLSELAGAGLTVKRCLLEGYKGNTHHRQDNSTLKVSIDTSLISGDPLFKRPSVSTFYTPVNPNETNHNHAASHINIQQNQDHMMLNTDSHMDPGIIMRDTKMDSVERRRTLQPLDGLTSGHSASDVMIESQRVDSTRVDPENLIKELVATNLAQNTQNINSSSNNSNHTKSVIVTDGKSSPADGNNPNVIMMGGTEYHVEHNNGDEDDESGLQLFIEKNGTVRIGNKISGSTGGINSIISSAAAAATVNNSYTTSTAATSSLKYDKNKYD